MRHVRQFYAQRETGARVDFSALVAELRDALRAGPGSAEEPESHLVSRSMKELVDALHPRQFVRIHRSAIVNVERIRELRTDDYRDDTVILRDGQRLQLSRSYRQALENTLGDRI